MLPPVAEKGVHRIRPVDPAARDVPVPQSAGAPAQGGLQATADLLAGAVGAGGLAGLEAVGEPDADDDDRGGGDQDDLVAGARAPAAQQRLDGLEHRHLSRAAGQAVHGGEHARRREVRGPWRRRARRGRRAARCRRAPPRGSSGRRAAADGRRRSGYRGGPPAGGGRDAARSRASGRAGPRPRCRPDPPPGRPAGRSPRPRPSRPPGSRPAGPGCGARPARRDRPGTPRAFPARRSAASARLGRDAGPGSAWARRS